MGPDEGGTTTTVVWVTSFPSMVAVLVDVEKLVLLTSLVAVNVLDEDDGVSVGVLAGVAVVVSVVVSVDAGFSVEVGSGVFSLVKVGAGVSEGCGGREVVIGGSIEELLS